MIVIATVTVVRPPASPAALLVVPPPPAHGAAAAAVAVVVVPADRVLARRAALAVHLGVVHLEVDRLQERERECVQAEWCVN